MEKVRLPDQAVKYVERYVYEGGLGDDRWVREILYAMLSWIGNHPILPNQAQCDTLRNKTGVDIIDGSLRDIVREWQRIMFTDADNHLEGLLWKVGDGEDAEHNVAVREAYRRGKEGR